VQKLPIIHFIIPHKKNQHLFLALLNFYENPTKERGLFWTFRQRAVEKNKATPHKDDAVLPIKFEPLQFSAKAVVFFSNPASLPG
jgi:hypothetical protein